MAKDLNLSFGALALDMSAKFVEGLLGCGFNSVGVYDRRAILDLLKEDAMRSLRLTLIRLEGEEAKDAGKVTFANLCSAAVFVGDLGESTHGVLGRLHVLLAEGLITHSDSLDDAHSASTKWLKGFLGKHVGKSTEAIGNSVLYQVAVGEVSV